MRSPYAKPTLIIYEAEISSSVLEYLVTTFDILENKEYAFLCFDRAGKENIVSCFDLRAWNILLLLLSEDL